MKIVLEDLQDLGTRLKNAFAQDELSKTQATTKGVSPETLDIFANQTAIHYLHKETTITRNWKLVRKENRYTFFRFNTAIGEFPLAQTF